MRITTRRLVGRLTSANPAAAKTLRLPTWSSTAHDLLPGLRDHRIALERTGAALAGEADGGVRERTADAAAAEARAGDEARHGPHAVVGLVLRPPLPRDAGLEQQARVGGARLDRAPAGGLAVEVGDEAARRARPGMAAVGLRAEPEGELLGADRGPGLAGRILYRWQEHRDGSPRVPNTARSSSQLASLAGTILTRSLGHLSSRESRRSLRTRPSVWQCGQYVMT